MHESGYKKLLTDLFGSILDRDIQSIHSYSLHREKIGDLTISSGQLVARDPTYNGYHDLPYEQEFPRGVFPAYMCEATFEDESGKDSLIAFAYVLFSEDPIVDWEVATRKLAEVSNALIDPEDERYCVGSEGTIALMDLMDSNKVSQINDSSKESEFVELIYESMPTENGGCGFVEYENITGFPSFSSGWGAGEFPAAIGKNVNGEFVSYIIDFCVIEMDDISSSTFPAGHDPSRWTNN